MGVGEEIVLVTEVHVPAVTAAWYHMNGKPNQADGNRPTGAGTDRHNEKAKHGVD